MAIINGSVTGGTFAQYYSFWIEWEIISQSIINNTSVIRVKTIVRKDKASQTTYGNNKTITQVVNGVSRSATFSYDFRGSVTQQTLIDETYTVSHNTDGTKQIAISATTNFGTALLGAASASGTAVLTTIPRASTPTAISSTTGSNMQVNIAAASSAFRHEVVVAIGGYSNTVSAAAGATSVLVPTSISWANAIPNAASGTATITLRTYNGSTLIGTKTTTATLLVAASIVPTVSGTLTPQNLLQSYYVQGKSSVKVELTGAGAYGSTIPATQYSGGVNNTAYSGQSFTHTFILSGNAVVGGAATDTRGRTASWKDFSIHVQPYASPTIEAFEVIRCNSDGTSNTDGEYLKAYLKARTQEVGNGENVNTHEFWVTFTPHGGAANRINLPSTAATVDATTAPIQVGKVTTYVVTAYVKDYYETVTQYREVPTVERILNFGADGKSMAIGKVAEMAGLEIAWAANFENDVNIEGMLGTIESFTPRLYGLTAAGTPTYTEREGTLKRRGKEVTLEFRISVSSKGGMSGRLAFEFPTTISSLQVAKDTNTIAFWGITTNTPYITLRPQKSTKQGTFLRADLVSVDALNAEHFGNSWGMSGEITYLEA